MRGIYTVVALLLLPLAAVPLAAGQVTLTGGVANVAPVVGVASFGTSSYDPTANGNTAVAASVAVVDTNGCSDVNGGSATVMASIVLATDSTQVLAGPTQMTAGSCTTGTSQAFTISLNMPYYAAATNYKVKVIATDRAAGANTLVSAATFAYTTLTAMGSSTPNGFSFGSAVAPGSSSPTGQSIAIYNGGNTQVDATLLGTELTLASPAATIPVDAIKYSINSDMSSSGTMSGSSATLSTFNLAAGNAASKALYLQLVVPTPTTVGAYLPAGTYTGTVTVGVVAG
ncbi:MAG TPA: hypothetical protein VM286_06145 [Candidatus Thermoplasmatota archaeon]|nr:hypothetical protein [Candidatus Thermoplasmatota archaeon]